MIEDNVKGRLYQNQFDYVAENFLNEVGDNLTTKVGKPIYLYKFRKTSGNIKLTNLGERSIDYDNNIFRQTTNVYTGKEPITVVWEDSTKLSVDNQDNIIKECKVGTYYELYFEDTTDNNLTIDNLQILDKNYVNSYITKNLQLKSYNWEVNENDTLEYVYLILDKRNQSLQWLEITNYRNYYQEETRKFIESEITFESVNLKYSQSGKTLIDFIQLGSLGEGYAFPKEEYDTNGKATISLDQDLLLRANDGVSQIQYDFNNGVGNSDFLFWGRVKETLIKEENGVYQINVAKPQMLFPYRANFPKSGTFFYNKPNLNSYVVLNASPTKQEVWASYKEAYKGNNRIGEYNVDKTKQVLTGFKCDLTQVRNSNKDWKTNLNWDNQRSVALNLPNTNLTPIPYVKNINQINRQATYCEFFVINSFLNWYTDVIKFDYRETTKWKLTDTLGILGSITNQLVGGLDIGWTSTNTLGPDQPLNFLIPCISFEDGKSALSDQAPLPSDIFIDSNIKKVLPTSTNVLTSWNLTLTDQFIDTSITDNLIKEEGKGLNGIWNTKYLGQTTDEQGRQLLQDGRQLELNLNTFVMYKPSTNNGFIVDIDKHHTIGECDYKVSGYNANNETIYTLYSETNAKARNEITLWENMNKYNYYDKFNTLGQSTWPKQVIPPSPPVEFRQEWIYSGKLDLFEGDMFGDFYKNWPSDWTNPRVWSVATKSQVFTKPMGVSVEYNYDCKRTGTKGVVSTFNGSSSYSFQYKVDLPYKINPDNYQSVKFVLANKSNFQVPIDGQLHELITAQNKQTNTVNEDYAAFVGGEKLSASNAGLLQLSYDLSRFAVQAQYVDNQLSLEFYSTIENIKVKEITTTLPSSIWLTQQIRPQQGNLTNGFDKISIAEIYLLP